MQSRSTIIDSRVCLDPVNVPRESTALLLGACTLAGLFRYGLRFQPSVSESWRELVLLSLVKSALHTLRLGAILSCLIVVVVGKTTLQLGTPFHVTMRITTGMKLNTGSHIDVGEIHHLPPPD